MFSATMRRLLALAGGIGLSLIVANSVNAAVVPITSGSHDFSACTTSCGTFLFSDTMAFSLAEETTVYFTLTDTSADLLPPGSDYSFFVWGLYHQIDIPLFSTPLTSGSGFGSLLGGITLGIGDYKLVVGGKVNTFGSFLRRKTNGGSYTYEIGALQTEVTQTPIPTAALLFGSGLAVLGFTGRSRKKKTAA